jgi:hypothetical protein
VFWACVVAFGCAGCFSGNPRDDVVVLSAILGVIIGAVGALVRSVYLWPSQRELIQTQFMERRRAFGPLPPEACTMTEQEIVQTYLEGKPIQGGPAAGPPAQSPASQPAAAGAPGELTKRALAESYPCPKCGFRSIRDGMTCPGCKYHPGR